ncbi:hypothetical protein D9758_018111 [Tetrapyrgos nigripes]|uniref:F-box domain-containing protein n=1 Tax=Tetrapyrgos nigripes TaxID=182062 RepID=A0A8H5EXU3_9AGAR|nr:hypothetical protein D9758_018111 [Tetrapyrgos nigripes]
MTTATTTFDSPFSHLLSSNYAASDSDVPLVKAIITSSSDTLRRLNSKVQKLQTALRELEQKRNSVQIWIDAHRALLSPSRRLPAELLSEIFAHCLPRDRNPNCSQSEAPILLGRVCRTWRQVSLSTPYLWASIHIVLPIRASRSVILSWIDARREGVETWLGRSGSLPLSISVTDWTSTSYGSRDDSITEWTLTSHGPRDDSVLEHIRLFLGCIFRRSSRWHTVQLHLNRDCTSMLLECWPWGGTKELPLLHTFKLRFLAGTWHSYPEFEYKWLAKAPRLQRLSLRHGDLGGLLEQQFAWAQISHLEFQARNIRLSSIIKVLRQCSLLQSLTVGGLGSRADTLPDSIQTISLPSLRSLSIAGQIGLADHASPVDVRNIFAYLDAPALRCLRVTVTSTRIASFGCIPFIGLLGPGNQIEELDINIQYDLLGNILSLLPNLSIARIRSRLLDDTLLRRLTPSPSQDEPLCPSLTQLYLLGHISITNDEHLLDLARSRWNSATLPSSHTTARHGGIARLVSFHVLLNRYEQTPSLQDQLQELRTHGMDIIFACWGETRMGPSYGQVVDEDNIDPYITYSRYSNQILSEMTRKHSWWLWD